MNFVELFRSRSVPTAAANHHHTRQGWVNVNCPYCPPSNSFHLGFNLRFNSCHCWKCGRRPVLETLVLLTRMSRSECTEFLKQLPRRGGFKKFATERKASGKYLPPHVGPLGPRHVAYLRDQRNLDPELIERTWDIKGIGIARGSESWRIFIPIYLGDHPVSWTTRSILKAGNPRYWSAAAERELIPHKELLYGEHLCESHTIIVHEGPIDVWTTGPGAVCTFGIDYSESQLSRIAAYPRRIICFDNTPDAQTARQSRRLAQSLAILPGETLEVKLSGKDANSSPQEEIQELRRFAGFVK